MKLMKNKILTFLIIFFVTMSTVLSIFCPTIVRAEDSNTYTDVMTDLKKDSSFSISNYPSMTLEYFNNINSDASTLNNQLSVEIIQIAESNKKELFLYVYQPTDSEIDLKCTAISMSTEYSIDGQGLNLDIYYLDLVSTYGVFDKYLVKEFSVSNDLYRYYNIVTVYREFNSIIDTPAGGSVTEDYEVGVEVGQQWCASYKNDNLVYEKGTFETMDIDITFTGSLRFSNGFTMEDLASIHRSGDAWFIVFNIDDYIATHIYDADLTYKVQECMEDFLQYKEYGWSDDIKVYLSDLETVSFTQKGFFSSVTYEWNRISTASDFLLNAQRQGIELSSEVQSALSNSQWVFSFLETEYTYIPQSNNVRYWSDVSDVTVLRIHFLDISGKTYNLGVVSDRVNPNDSPDGGVNYTEPFNWLNLLIAIFALFLILWFLQFIGILPLIQNLVWFILTAPFKFIGWLFKRNKE